MQFLLQIIWFLAPMGVANISASIFKKQWRVLARPIDGGRKFFGQPLFGDHKTWRGLLLGTIAGGLIFILQQALYSIPSFQYLSLYEYPEISSHYGFLVGFGALFGDLIRAFFKRRFGIPPGNRWIPFDQLDYLVGGLAFTSFYIPLTSGVIVASLIIGFFLHILVNYVGYYLGIKDFRW